MSDPARGEVWEAELGKLYTPEVRGHEQGDRRRCLVVSNDDFNFGHAGLVVIVAITTQDKRIPTHIQIDPPDGGQTKTGFIMP